MAAYDDPYGDSYTGPGGGYDDTGYNNQQPDPGRQKSKAPWGEEFDPLDPGFLGDHKAPDGAIWRFNPHNLQWEMTTPAPAGTTTTGGGDGGGGGGGGGDTSPPPGGGELTNPFPDKFAAPAVRFPGATGTGVPETPQFNAPGYTKPPAFSYADWNPTTAADVTADPGYQFGLSEGERALQQSAAAGGVLNTGGTLKDIVGWGQNYATQRFNDVNQRRLGDYSLRRGNAVQDYNLNYGTQYTDPYAIAYKGALDTFAPRMVAYTTNANANQRSNELDYSRAYDLFTGNRQYYSDWQDRVFDKRFKTSTA